MPLDDPENENSHNTTFFSQQPVLKHQDSGQSECGELMAFLEQQQGRPDACYEQVLPLARRRVVVRWLLATCRKLRLQERTCYLSVDLFDRAYPLCYHEPDEGGRAGLLAVTCLHIASKFEEIYPRGLDELL